MSGDPEDIEKFMASLIDEWDKKKFKAAFQAAQTATLFIDMSCRANFKKSKGGAGLAGSFKEAPIIKSGRGLVTGSYSPLPYAGIRETGGRINRKSKRLTIPMTKNAKNTGSPLNWKGGKPLVYLYKKSSAGSGYAGVLATIKRARHKKTPATYNVQYALRNYVVHPKSGYLSFAQKMSAPAIAKICADFVVEAVKDTKAPKAR